MTLRQQLIRSQTARVRAAALCPSVCLLQVGVLSKQLDESSWFSVWKLPSTYSTLCRNEIRVSSKGTSRSGTLSQTKDLENFASEYQSVCVIKLSRVTHWDQSASIKLFLKYFDLESTQLIARTHVMY